LHLPDYFDTIAFHCQQAVEKYIKAILVHREIVFDRSHEELFSITEFLFGFLLIELTGKGWAKT
jgi:hypothetical protein